jgi:lysophospholipase L1-like esterase
MVATGGIATGGISTGGIVATGGVQATGGIVATGGITTTGGVQSTGGVVTTGGITTTGGVNASGGTGGLTHTGVWKVMLLGDGMSARTCYPQLLAKDFKNQGHTNFQFVGTATISQSCNGTPAVQTEDHAGTRVTNLSSSTIQGWASQKPDIAIMDLGGDDAGDGVSPGDILSAYLSLIGQFRSQNPKVIFFISKVTPKDSSKVPNWGTQVVNLNAQITNAWATKNATATSPIYIIDQWTGFSTSADTSDGVLPDMSGAQKMADNACAAVAAHNYF